MSHALATTYTLNPSARKAAIVLIQLGHDGAASVLSHMSEAEVEAIGTEIARLETIGTAEAGAALTEFQELASARSRSGAGGINFARHLLEETLGDARATVLIERMSTSSLEAPFTFLHRADPEQLTSYICDEHPQVIALVLAHLPPEKASPVLERLDPALQTGVAHRIAVMDQTTAHLIRAVEGPLKRRLSSMLTPAQTSPVGGVDALVSIINRSGRNREHEMLAGLQDLDADLANEVRSRLFLFEDIVDLEDRSIQLVMRQVDAGDLAVALKGVPDAVRDKVTSNLSEGASANLLDEVEVLGAVRLRQVEEARQKVIAVIRQLEEQGQIVVRRGGDDEFVV
ncbi:MAG: flagellar motor switch protein FliG [Candidatus Nanopelagicales bacterium]